MLAVKPFDKEKQVFALLFVKLKNRRIFSNSSPRYGRRRGRVAAFAVQVEKRIDIKLKAANQFRCVSYAVGDWLTGPHSLLSQILLGWAKFEQIHQNVN